MMKKNRKQSGGRMVRLAVSVAIAGVCLGCSAAVVSSFIAGLQDGLITTTTGVVNAVVEQQSTGTPVTAGEGGGDDLFGNM